MTASLFGLLALVSLALVLAYRYRAGRQHPRVPQGSVGQDAARPGVPPTVCVYGQECTAVRTAGSGIYVTGSDVILMEDDTIRVDGRSFTVTRLRRPESSIDAVLITGLRELP